MVSNHRHQRHYHHGIKSYDINTIFSKTRYHTPDPRIFNVYIQLVHQENAVCDLSYQSSLEYIKLHVLVFRWRYGTFFPLSLGLQVFVVSPSSVFLRRLFFFCPEGENQRLCRSFDRTPQMLELVHGLCGLLFAYVQPTMSQLSLRCRRTGKFEEVQRDWRGRGRGRRGEVNNDVEETLNMEEEDKVKKRCQRFEDKRREK